jgi:hypothetical protein
MLVYLFFALWDYISAIWYILWPFGNLVAIWYISPRFGILCQDKSGNPGSSLAQTPNAKKNFDPQFPSISIFSSVSLILCV